MAWGAQHSVACTNVSMDTGPLSATVSALGSSAGMAIFCLVPSPTGRLLPTRNFRTALRLMTVIPRARPFTKAGVAIAKGAGSFATCVDGLPVGKGFLKCFGAGWWAMVYGMYRLQAIMLPQTARAI